MNDNVTQQPAAAIPALPDSQFVDAATHVAIDSEIREGMATLPADFDSVAHLRQDLHPDTDYGRALQQVRFFAADLMEKHGEIHNLESELAAAKAEIKRLRGLLGEAKQTFLGVQLTLWSVNGRTGELLATKGLDAIDTGVVEGMARHSKRSTQDVGDMLAKLESDTQS